MAEPKCPSCEVVGTSFIVSKDSDEESKGGDAWFNIVHCSECGHVYGVFAKTVLSPSIRMPSI
jgi:uncharacterized Zn finger protein